MILTASDLTSQLKELGLAPGQLVMVHSSLSAFGYVLGGPQTVVNVLLDILGKKGTLVMPAFTPRVSDPENWDDVDFGSDFDGADLIRARAEVPCFDKHTTPTTMGQIPEIFRSWPGTIRSDHPQASVCANGLHAEQIVHPHPLEWGQGPGSPFERLYNMDAHILVLGVGFNRITLLHYAESLAANGRRKVRKVPFARGNDRVWKNANDVGDDLNTHFPIIGDKFTRAGHVVQHTLGNAKCGLMSSQALIDFSVRYFDDTFITTE